MTNFEWLRSRLEPGILGEHKQCLYSIEELERTQWSPSFIQYMKNRLIMGALRYGVFSPYKQKYDNTGSIKKHLDLYLSSGNKEHLVDIANLALCEFVNPSHKNAHFKAIDDCDHHTNKL